LSSSSYKGKIKIPGAARAGLSLLILGATFVGIGSYTHRGGISLYGLVIAIVGFSLYMASSLIVARRKKRGSTASRNS